MKIIIFQFVLFCIGFITAFAQNARDIMEKASETVEFEAIEMAMTLKIYDAKGSERIRQINTVSKKFGLTNKTLMKFVSPADVKGTAILVYDHENASDDMWIYMPALRKTRRIVSGERGKNFMGSEFTNADMSKPSLDDFNYKLLGTATLNGMNCWKIEAACKDKTVEDEYGFSKKVAYIGQGNYLCYKVEFYDLDGRLYKTQIIGQYKKQPDGKYIAGFMEMRNEQNGRKSMIQVDNFRLGSNLTESTFVPSMLER
jgi:hypothetical protein